MRHYGRFPLKINYLALLRQLLLPALPALVVRTLRKEEYTNFLVSRVQR